jgi:hypothetical protein
MTLVKGRDRMTTEQAARIARLTQTFDNGRVTLDEEGKLDAILDAIDQVAAVIERGKQERNSVRLAR